MAQNVLFRFPFSVFTAVVLLTILISASVLDSRFAITAGICLVLSAGFLYGLKWYRKTYFATRRRQERRNRANALKG